MPENPNSFDARGTLSVGGKEHTIYRLDALQSQWDVARLPFSLKVLLENLLRTEGNGSVSKEDIEALAGWDADAEPSDEIAFTPARVVMQDFTGVPAIVDLAAMRDAMADLGGDASKINPLVPAELVIDHSVQVDVFGTRDAFVKNAEREFERNEERYAFLRWGQDGFDNFTVVPPDTGIVHQVNLEYLARTVFVNDKTGEAYPDTLVGTDSHTTMINGLGVLGWGVGGIEAEAAMLGQPMSMLIPQVIGFKLTGALPEGATATDLVLTVTELLRKKGVVGKFVEFYGPGVSALPLADRATIGNMSPEFGSTCAIFPIDAETLRYLKFSGRPQELVDLVEAYAKEQGMWHDESSEEPTYSDTVTLDLGDVVPSLAGPKRPQDRVSLSDAKESFREALAELVDDADSVLDSHDEAEAESFPASDPPANGSPGHDAPTRGRARGGRWPPAPRSPSARSRRVEVTLDGESFKLDHGHVVIAAITSCTNTSNPSVMLGAGLVARNAVARGPAAPAVGQDVAGARARRSSPSTSSARASTSRSTQLGFNLVGYGCTTCIGNSGPLPEEVSAAVDEGDLAVVSVLSGNRNFEGRINPDVKMNYLASPPLVVAYALAGTMDIDLVNDPLGSTPRATRSTSRTSGRPRRRSRRPSRRPCSRDMFRSSYGEVFDGDERWNGLDVPEGDRFAWAEDSTYVRQPPYFEDFAPEPSRRHRHRGRQGAREARRQRHDRPHLAGRRDQGGQPGRRLPQGARRREARVQLLRLAARQPRGDGARHVREHPPAQPARAGHRGRLDEEGRRGAVDLRRGHGLRRGGHAARRARRQGVRLGLVARLGGQGHEPARRPRRDRRELRAHPPLEPRRHGRAAADVPRRRERRLAGPVGRGGVHDHRAGRAAERGRACRRTVQVKAGDVEFEARVRIDTPKEADYFRHGGILQYVLRSLAA